MTTLLFKSQFSPIGLNTEAGLEDYENEEKFLTTVLSFAKFTNYHYKTIAKEIIVFIHDESRIRTPNYNHDGSSGNPAPNTNWKKPIPIALEYRTIACPTTNIILSFRPVLGEKDIYRDQADGKLKEYLLQNDIRDSNSHPKMAWAVLTALPQLDILEPHIDGQGRSLSRLLLVDSAFISVQF